LQIGGRLYKGLTTFVNTDVYPEIPEPENPEDHPDFHNMTQEQKRRLRNDNKVIRKQWLEDLKIQSDNKPVVYHLMYSALSDESRQKVEETEDFEKFDLTKDPLALWRAIYSTHH
jgi:hypothetical protein